ncbi:Putative DNA-binding protein in cluster with Type I restriction-modification system [Alloactinosynnema sp. L-07]|uniref:helix-turn-helix domain-containing protein n=1 Tax=Alloactinosynnema sp. L-07 TaxID=1653480 RepID=UPI00065EFDD0|nr:helix-turn-helix transcriptional regulator [Alloactinosynnema sp. L-07]CRK62036.1 Putative DNA-binding protein in cluster with Type I restriction-modification system [Alloactinosynnema sp. L-07]
MRSIGTQLKDFRDEVNLTIREAEQLSGFSMAKISRIENAIRDITVEDAAILLGVYGVKGPARERVLELVRNLGQPCWWEAPADYFNQHAITLKDCEAGANWIVESAMLRVPGLLQTSDYTRTILLRDGVPADTVQMLVEFRLARQEVLHRKVKAPHFLAVIDEAVFARPTGSPALMVAQIKQICDLADLPHIDVRVVPFEAGQYVGLAGSYVILGSHVANPVVFLEHPQSSLFVHGDQEVAIFQEVTTMLRRAALSSAESVKFLRRLEDKIGRE